ncbi:hypothetical protein M1116_03400 [Patescibacteria group bacterium]|nr:hypothetical protein [Patescibacteria group bacterium]
MKASSSLRSLIVSGTRLKIIHQLFYFPNEIRYVRELVRGTGEEINSVRRELSNLKESNVVESEVRGNRLYYWANPSSSLYDDLLLLTHKSSGLGAKLANNKVRLGKLKYVLYSRDFICNNQKKTGTVDIIFVGNPTLKVIESLIKAEEERRGREINYMVMDKQELILRKTRRDPFIIDFFLSYPAVIIGSSSSLSNIE